MNTYEVDGRVFPVTGYAKVKGSGEIVPVLDIPMMSDARWREITEASENLARIEVSRLREAGK